MLNDGSFFLPLGHVQFVRVSSDIEVANMIGQHGMVSPINPHPISYAALNHCLEKVARVAGHDGATVHMPRIGTGLARGKWEVIESIINRTMTLRDIDVTVYDL
jgi:O-acetyl-ADP-ribose deacetylase (regulator of RNase III)